LLDLLTLLSEELDLLDRDTELVLKLDFELTLVELESVELESELIVVLESELSVELESELIVE
jgi:hypothetical protein